MKTTEKSCLTVQTVLLAVLSFAASTARSQSIPGLPEPGLVMYGSVTNSTTGQPLIIGAVSWQISGGGENTTVNATIACVNGQSWCYVARVPFETRSVSGVTFGKTAGTFALTTAATTYTRMATVDGKNATLVPASLGSFSFGAAQRGKIERVDLQVSIVVDPSLDSDGDGMTDLQELIAGTDPHNKDSVFKAETDIQPDPTGGLVLKWASVAGKSYSVYRTSDLDVAFTLLKSGIAATAPQNSYPDAGANGQGPYFYRIKVE